MILWSMIGTIDDIFHHIRITKPKGRMLYKYDPNIHKRDGFENIDEIILFELLEKIKEMMPSWIDYDIMKTSIFTTFLKISVNI